MGCKLSGLFRFSYSMANLRFFFNWKWLALLALLLCPSHSRYQGCHLFAMWSLAPTALWLTWWDKLAQATCLEASPVLGHLEIMEQCTELTARADKRVRLKLDQICPPAASACITTLPAPLPMAFDMKVWQQKKMKWKEKMALPNWEEKFTFANFRKHTTWWTHH